MNLLTLAGALMTASASVSTGFLKMDHHQNKMMDVEYKYESNEVYSNDDLVVGNIYEFKANGFNTDDILYENDNLVFKLIYGEITFSSYSFDELYILSNFEIPINSYIALTSIYLWVSFSTDIGSQAFDDITSENYLSIYDVSFSSDFVVQLIDFNTSNDDFYTFLHPTNYNEIVPSNSHRGNLYTTIYDFFYGIFDTSDTNELSMTIMGQNMNMTSWLAHTVTIALLLLGVLWLILVIRWIFRVFSGLVKI